MSSQTVFRFTVRNGVDNIQAFKEPIPMAGQYELLIKVRSVALNQRDVHIATDTYPLPVEEGVIPGSDMAGEVAQVGDLVKGFSIEHGSDTFGALRDGMLREYVVLPAHSTIKLPNSSHSFTQWAALVQSGATVWNAFYGNIALKPGDTVLALGTGGVSMIALILAKAAGATTIITSSSDRKLELVKSRFGVDYTINYNTHPNWASEVQRITNGQGANHIIETSGVGTIGQSLESVARGGIVSMIGFMTTIPQEEMPDVAMLSLVKGCAVRGVQGGSKQQLEEAVRFVASRELVMPVDKAFSFSRDNIVVGLKYIQSGKHIGKVCINLE
ncbi:Zinc-type alcohol dehydrogenase-like protein [Lachnellula willkommii]|uniref:Zinc-type alcohol dehydrogenase-like protein n=1 Tax=Lachnellula willkommii TaxID=215461 RepID=A0A559M2J9_9HELO|nr:Zinc-type alcohol dehydrogenase-like protein [Lachnellula willkommii]